MKNRRRHVERPTQFQFSLATLMWLVTLCAGVLGVWKVDETSVHLWTCLAVYAASLVACGLVVPCPMMSRAESELFGTFVMVLSLGVFVFNCLCIFPTFGQVLDSLFDDGNRGVGVGWYASWVVTIVFGDAMFVRTRRRMVRQWQEGQENIRRALLNNPLPDVPQWRADAIDLGVDEE